MKGGYILLFAALMSVCSSCRKEEEIVYRTDFSGDENRIASFTLLSSEGKRFSATLCDDEILMALPADTEFDRLKPEYLLAENTSLQPDPADVKDWSSEQRFLVTSYTGENRVYVYRVSIVESEDPQTVVLATQAEVDAFGKSGQTRVTGNLIIGTNPESYDDTGTVTPITEIPVTSLSALSKLQQVDGELLLKPTYMGTNLDGLNAVEVLGGFRIYCESSGWCSTLRSIYFPALKSIATNLSCHSNKLQDIDMPLLQSVGGNLDIQTADLQLLKMPALETVKSRLYLDGSEMKEPSGFPTVNPIASLAFPLLKSVPYIYLGNWESVTALDFSSLESVDDIYIFWCSYLSDFSSFVPVIPLLDANHWYVGQCAYNPTWQEMVDGKYNNK